MRRRIFWIFVGTPLALITLAAGTAAALPTTRHIASALWNLPDRLPALPENSQIHFEPGEGYAREIAYAFVRLPNWFKEGLAVMVSEGGGAEFVNEAEARAAIERGEHIAINDSGSIFSLSDVRFERGPPPGTRSHQIVTADRPAGSSHGFTIRARQVSAE
jgi:hypothetical protein